MGDGGDGDGGSGAGDGAGDGGGGGGIADWYMPSTGWDVGWTGGAMPSNDVNLTEEQQRRLRGLPQNGFGWNFGLTQGNNNAMDFDPTWFSSLGFNGPLMQQVGGAGSEGTPGASAPSSELRNWMDSKGYELAQSYSGEKNGDNYLARMVDANGKTVGQEHKWSAVDDPGGWLGLAWGAMLGAGAIAPAAAAAGAGVGTTAAIGAGVNAGTAYGSGASWGDIAKAAAAGGAGSAIGAGVDYVNPGGAAGLDGIYGKAANKAISGGLTSLATGGNPLVGAAAGAGQVGANQMWDSFLKEMGGSNDFSQNFSGGFSQGPQTNSMDWITGPTVQPEQNYSAAPQSQGINIMDYFNGNPQMRAQGGGEEQGQDPYDMAQFGHTPHMGAGVVPGTSGNPEWMDYLRKNGTGIARGLAGLYMGQRQSSMMGKARSQLDALYSPNSPYATQMRQNIMRHDAASGRRSQVAPREVQLAAALTNARGQQLSSPGYQQLMQGQLSGGNQGIGTLLNLLGNQGTRGMFTGLPGAVSSGYDSLSQMFGG